MISLDTNGKSPTILTHDNTHNSVTHASDGDSDSELKKKVLVEQEVVGEEENNNNSLMKQLERNRNSTRDESRRNGYRFKNWIQSTDGNNPIEKDNNENDKLIHTINIMEEDSNIPKLLIKVGASAQTEDVTYFINSTNYDPLDFSRKFRLNSTSGELYLVTPLDRDLPFGRSRWHFSIMAKRVYSMEPFGYADVVINVNDINDNTPFFEKSLYHAQILENSPPDMSIIQVTATDYDSPINGNNKVRYLIDRNHLNRDGNTIFAIDSQTGLITSSVCCLDREINTQFVLQITAVDSGGLKGSTTVIINIIDVNDCGPKFSQRSYKIEIFDEIKINSTLLYVSVNDEDLPTTNHNKFEIRDKSNQFVDLLSVVDNYNNTCFIIVKKNISQINERIIDFTLVVSDSSATEDTTDYATLQLIININRSICSNGIFCHNGGNCVKNNNSDHKSYNNRSADDSYRCECLIGFKGVFCDLSISDDDYHNDMISANKLYEKVVDWFNSDDSKTILILFGLINLLVILLIAFIYRQISRKFDTNRTRTERSDPLPHQTINNSLTEEQNITSELNLNEVTVISVPSHDYCCEQVVEELVGDQCPDVVDCCSRVPSRTRHVFISDGNTKWQQKSIAANCSSLDDIRLYGNDMNGLRIWTTNASASMELMDSQTETNVIYV